MNKLKVFIGWSGIKSKSAAQALREWLPHMIQATAPWLSSVDIAKGERWAEVLDSELNDANVCIVCVTAENKNSTWLHFEAGAISKNIVCPWLIDLTESDLSGPLGQLQATIANNKEDTLKLIRIINNALDESPLEEQRLNYLYDKLWPDLEQKLHSIQMMESESKIEEPNINGQIESIENNIILINQNNLSTINDLLGLDEDYMKDRVNYPIKARRNGSIGIIDNKKYNNLTPFLKHLIQHDEIEQEVLTILKKNNILVIHGEYGAGKKTLAMQVAQSYILFSQETSGIVIEIDPACEEKESVIDKIALAFECDYIKGLNAIHKEEEIIQIFRSMRAVVIITNIDGANGDIISFIFGLATERTKIVATAHKPQYYDSVINYYHNKMDSITFQKLFNELNQNKIYNATLIDFKTISDIINQNPLALKMIIGLIEIGSPINEILKNIEQRDRSIENFAETAFNLCCKKLNDKEILILNASILFPTTCNRDALLYLFRTTHDNHEKSVFDETINKLLTLGLLYEEYENNQSSLKLHFAIRKFISKSDNKNIFDAKKRYINYYIDFVKEKIGNNRRDGVKDLYPERTNIIKAMILCEELLMYKEYVDFHMRIYHMLWVKGYWNQNLSNANSAVEYGQKLKLMNECGWIRMECLGWIEYLRGNYELAYRHYNKADEDFEEDEKISNNKDLLAKARLFNYRGRLATAKGEYSEAIELLWKGMRYAEDKLTYGYIEGAIGDYYFAKKEYNAAKNHYESAKKLAKAIESQPIDKFRECSIECDLADVSLAKGDYKDAQEKYKEALIWANKNERIEIIARCYYGLGVTEAILNSAIKSFYYFSNAKMFFQQLGKHNEVERTNKTENRLKDIKFTLSPSENTPHVEPRCEIVLVNAPRSFPSTLDDECQDHRLPLGLMYIATFLTQRAVQTKLIDAEGECMGIGELISKIKELSPKIVGLNCHTHNRRLVYEIAHLLRILFGENLLIVLGGPHPTADYKGTFDECNVMNTVIVVGEGERSMYELCRRWSPEKGVNGLLIPNIYIGNNANVNLMPRIHNLDDLGIPSLFYDSINVKKHQEYEDKNLPGFWNRAYISATRGCKHACEFCAECHAWSHEETHRSAESIIKEMDEINNKYTLSRFYFYDDTLNDWKNLKNFCTLSKEKRYSWSCSTRIDKINEEWLSIMHEGGCAEIAFGLESGSIDILKKSGKIIDLEQVKNNIGLCVNIGITPRAHFMIGFPDETKQQIEETVRFAVSLKLQGLRDVNFFVVKIYPSTGLCKTVLKKSTNNSKRIYDTWNINDWLSIKMHDKNIDYDKVRAKLRRFNDIPVQSVNQNFNSQQLRNVVRNAYGIFFCNNGVKPITDKELSKRLWQGINI
jgi:magnesium-protoporphyrin IX monomethyl ester (oxidative) cyclase